MSIWYLISMIFGVIAGMTVMDGPRVVTVIAFLGILVATFHEYIEVALKGYL